MRDLIKRQLVVECRCRVPSPAISSLLSPLPPFLLDLCDLFRGVCVVILLWFSRSALLWFWSYLCGRSQCVFAKQTTSTSREINIGVPQGSVLGPLLFCIYMNDIKSHLDDTTLRILYADDLQIYIQVPSSHIQEGISLLSQQLKGCQYGLDLTYQLLMPKRLRPLSSEHLIQLVYLKSQVLLIFP